MPVNDHRTRVTKMLIRRAFTDLLQFKPIQDISIRELCERAGINRGTFYTHYTDIYDLRAKIEDEMFADFQKTLEPLLSEKSESMMPLRLITGIFQCLKDNADICTVTLGPYGDKAFAEKLINLGRERSLYSFERLFRNHTRSELEYAYAFASSGCIGLLQKWIANGMTESAEEIAKLLTTLMSGCVEGQ